MPKYLLLGRKATDHLSEDPYVDSFCTLKENVSNNQGIYHYFSITDSIVLVIEDTSLVDMSYIQSEMPKEEFESYKTLEDMYGAD